MTNSASTKFVTHLGDRFMSSSSFTRYGLGERTFVDLTARDADEIPRRRLDGHRWTIGRELTDLRATPRAASDANP